MRRVQRDRRDCRRDLQGGRLVAYMTGADNRGSRPSVCNPCVIRQGNSEVGKDGVGRELTHAGLKSQAKGTSGIFQETPAPRLQILVERFDSASGLQPRMPLKTGSLSPALERSRVWR